MKLSFPLSPRYVLPILFFVLLLDLALAAGTAVVIYRKVDSVRVFEMDGRSCLTYSSGLLESTYMVIRCSPKAQE